MQFVLRTCNVIVLTPRQGGMTTLFPRARARCRSGRLAFDVRDGGPAARPEMTLLTAIGEKLPAADVDLRLARSTSEFVASTDGTRCARH